MTRKTPLDGNRMRSEPASLPVTSSLGTLGSEVAGAPGEHPGIYVELVKADGSSGIVSLTEVRDSDLAYGNRARLQTHGYDGVNEEPETIGCDPDGPSMSETEASGEAPRRDELVILERAGDTALIFDPDPGRPHYIVAHGFDDHDRSWQRSERFRDIVSAASALPGRPSPSRAVGAFTPEGVIDAMGGRRIERRAADMAARQLNALVDEAFFEALPIRIDEAAIARQVDRAEKALSGGRDGTGLESFAELKQTESSTAPKGSITAGERPSLAPAQPSEPSTR